MLPHPTLSLVSAAMLPVRPGAHSRRFTALALGVGALIAISGCGKGTHAEAGAGTAGGQVGEAPAKKGGVVGVSTKNTTRLGGAEPAEDAAAVAQAVYPGFTAATRPQTVVVVDETSWPAALAASVLAGAPLGAPLLYADDGGLPAPSERALEAMHPFGASALGGAQAIEIGTSAALPRGYKVESLAGEGAGGGAEAGAGAGGGTETGGGAGAPQPTSGAGGESSGDRAASAAVEVMNLLKRASGHPAHDVLVVASDAPQALQMPAGALAAESGAPILFVTSSGVPQATRKALKALKHPTIYVIAPKTLHSGPYATLARLGTVVHVTGDTGPGEGTAHASNDPVENAISISRFSQGSFGWGIHEAGHGLVFANVARPLDAPAAAPLSAHGDYGPLLLLSHSASVPAPLTHYLSDIEPGYTAAIPPVREVYNHGWLIGDESAISALAQAELDTVLEIAPRQPTDAEQSVVQAE
jgi:hypothetical protein